MRTEAQYLTLQLATGITWPDGYDTLQQIAQPPARALEAVDGNGTIIYGAACPLPARVRHLYECRPVPPVDVQQLGPPQYHWLPIAIDGTNRHEASYVHCTIGGTTSPDELASWWLMGGSEQWSTIYALAQEVDFDQALVDVSKVTTVDTGGATRQPLFFVCANGKVQILLSSCKNWKAESPHTIVCWVCGRNRADCLANFGTKQRIEMMWDANLPIIAVYRPISPARHIPDYGLHGVMRICICGIYGMRDSVVGASGKSPAVVARTLLRPILYVARLAAKKCTQGTVDSEGANEKGKVRLECAAVVHLMRNKGWETLIEECVRKGRDGRGTCCKTTLGGRMPQVVDQF